jgi:hypothetical protein
MAKFEMIREIFNQCSGNQMRDVDFTTVETDRIEDYVQSYIDDPKATVERYESGNGVTIFEIEISGSRERFTFTAV